MLKIISKIKFWYNLDRIAPDVPLTHWMLYSNRLMKKLCRKKFKYFGENAVIRPGAYIECCSKISIGDNVVIRPHSFIFADPESNGSGIIIEDYVLIGSNVHIYTSNHKFSNCNIPIYFQGYTDETHNNPVILKKGCWIGANVVILPNVQIGENSVVAAGSIVTKSVPPHVLVAGNPAKIIKYINDI
jgi:acetyltransferase-like isoleucine patch superfamily enzyme